MFIKTFSIIWIILHSWALLCWGGDTEQYPAGQYAFLPCWWDRALDVLSVGLLRCCAGCVLAVIMSLRPKCIIRILMEGAGQGW